MLEAYASKNDKTAVRRLKQLVSSLSESHSAATYLKEGLDETITIKRFGLKKMLERSLATTNSIEKVLRFGTLRTAILKQKQNINLEKK